MIDDSPNFKKPLELKKWYVVRDIIAQRGTPKDLMRRVGTINLTRDMIHNQPEFIMQIFSYMIPFMITIEDKKGYIEYACYSALFDPVVQPCKEFPLYRIGTAKTQGDIVDTVMVISKERDATKITKIITTEKN